jgi:hypothetical protein
MLFLFWNSPNQAFTVLPVETLVLLMPAAPLYVSEKCVGASTEIPVLNVAWADASALIPNTQAPSVATHV